MNQEQSKPINKTNPSNQTGRIRSIASIDALAEYADMPDDIAEQINEAVCLINSVDDMATETICDVIDSAVELNMKYFRAGLQYGALLIMQLLY